MVQSPKPTAKRAFIIAVFMSTLISLATPGTLPELASGNPYGMYGPPPPIIIPTISISRNGTIEPLTAGIVRWGRTYKFTKDISNHTLTVECDNIVIDGNAFALQEDDFLTGITLSGCSNVTIQNLTMKRAQKSIVLNNSPNNNITGTAIFSSSSYFYAISMDENSHSNSIRENKIVGSLGIEIMSNSNIIVNNDLTNSSIVAGGYNNTFHANNLTRSSISVSGASHPILDNNISGDMAIWRSSEITIQRNKIEGTVTLMKSSSCKIENNSIVEGNITLKGSSSNLIKNNNITRGGITLDNSVLDYVLEYSSDNVIRSNRIVNGTGLSLVGTTIVDANLIENCSSGLTWPITELVRAEMGNGTIYHNNFVSNAQQFTLAVPEGYFDGYYYVDNGQEGNYWSDYRGTDANGDGIGDSPYILQRGNEEQFVPFIIDRYPLMFPFDVENNAVVLSEPLPMLLVVAVSVAIAAVVAAGVLVFWKKRKR